MFLLWRAVLVTPRWTVKTLCVSCWTAYVYIIEPNFVSQISYSFVSVILFRYAIWCLTYETFCRSMSSDIYQEIINCKHSRLSLYETQFCACLLIRTRSMMAGSSFPHSLCLSIHSVYTADSCRPWSCTLIFILSLQGWSMATGAEFSNTVRCTTGTWKVCTNGKCLM